MSTQTAYDLESVKMPYLAGMSLRLLVNLIESPLTRWMLIGNLLRQAGITKLRELKVDDPPTYQPLYPQRAEADEHHRPVNIDRFFKVFRPPAIGFALPGVRDFVEAFRSRDTTPEAVAERALAAVRESDAQTPPLRAFVATDTDEVMRMAQASTERYRKGKPLGPLDGIPIAIKDELDMLPFPTTVGTGFLSGEPVREDSTVVTRLRATGAVLLGKTNMHEIGIGVTGHNPHHGTVRNPYDPDHYPGGSSSGSAAAVASGLTPIAVGADGGGSIRTPSSFCGVIGLKPTFGRVSEFGAFPLDWSVAHLGPIATRAEDAALLYSAIAGPDTRDPNSLAQPPVTLDGFDDDEMEGFRIGVYWPWFNHASAEVVQICKSLLENLERAGASIHEVEIAELDAARIAHLVIISTEMAASMDRYHRNHGREHSLEVRTDLALARAFTARDYVQAQRIRTRTIRNFMRALEHVDVLVTPTNACTAPLIRPSALPDGDSDLTTVLEVLRFVTPGNMTGLPAISFPAGYDRKGLPVGFQAIGRPWQEHILLRLARASESLVERREPKIRFNLL
jgi:Asp-tRNA(Asn)/Glu-tRNA(Gln) amidotransferase A subunit family amidase